MFANDEKPKNMYECMVRLKKGCEKLYDECDYPESYFNPPATEEEIAEIERILKFPLPDDYKEFLRFSNGARIMDNDIYGTDDFGMSDDYIPNGYLAIGRNELSGKRIAISKEDGTVYLLWDLREKSWDFEFEILALLEECEDLIDEHDREVARQKRREAGITEEQERAALRAEFEAERKRYEATLGPETVKKQREERDDLIARVLKALEEDTNKHN